MANEPVKTISGRRFRFGLLPPDRAYKVFMILVRNFGSALMSAVATSRAAGTKMDAATKERILEGMAGDFFGKLKDDEIQFALEELLSSASCLDQKPNGLCTLVGTFNGQLLAAFTVAVEAAKVNFADFLAAGLSLSALFSTTGSQSQSPSNPPTSTGISGSPVE